MKRDQRIAIKNKDDLTAFIIIGIMIFGMLLVSFDLTEDPNLTPRFFFIAVCVLISQIWLFFLILRNPDKFDTSVFKQAFFPIYAIYLISIIISVSNALNVYEVIWGFLKTITFLNFLSVFILLFSKSKNYERIITKLITVYSIIIIAYGIYELLSLILGGKLDLENTYLVTAGFRLRNLYSQMLFLTLPFTIFGIYLFRGFWRHISLTATLSVIALIPMLMTRSVWFGITLATLSSLIVFFLYNKHLKISKKSINRSILFLLIIVVLISGSVVVYSRLDSFETFRYRINEAFNFKHGSASTRLMLWDTTLDMIKNSPITGIGAENWKLIYPKFSGAYEYSPAGEALTPRRPHNDFLWVLSETGIIGCLLFIAIFSI
ncbi:MAG: O-antigen ligase family protein, partial [candidate division Zixibacteria bacterium]|nr:O-antigen ligase family protein [candidate division Zixibacteria bacterium]